MALSIPLADILAYRHAGGGGGAAAAARRRCMCRVACTRPRAPSLAPTKGALHLHLKHKQEGGQGVLCAARRAVPQPRGRDRHARHPHLCLPALLAGCGAQVPGRLHLVAGGLLCGCGLCKAGRQGSCCACVAEAAAAAPRIAPARSSLTLLPPPNTPCPVCGGCGQSGRLLLQAPAEDREPHAGGSGARERGRRCRCLRVAQHACVCASSTRAAAAVVMRLSSQRRAAVRLPGPAPAPAAQAMAEHLRARPELFPQILSTLFEIVLFEDCTNQWSLSRPMLRWVRERIGWWARRWWQRWRRRERRPGPQCPRLRGAVAGQQARPPPTPPARCTHAPTRTHPGSPQPHPDQRADLRAAEAADCGQPDARPAAAPRGLPRKADAGGCWGRGCGVDLRAAAVSASCSPLRPPPRRLRSPPAPPHRPCRTYSATWSPRTGTSSRRT